MIYIEYVAFLFDFKIFMYSCGNFNFLTELSASTAKSPEVIAACEEIP